MRKTIFITQRVDIHTDPIKPHVFGLRPEFIDEDHRGLTEAAYVDSILAHGYLDATNRIPAGSCYKSGAGMGDVWVYDRAIIRNDS